MVPVFRATKNCFTAPVLLYVIYVSGVLELIVVVFITLSTIIEKPIERRSSRFTEGQIVVVRSGDNRALLSIVASRYVAAFLWQCQRYSMRQKVSPCLCTVRYWHNHIGVYITRWTSCASIHHEDDCSETEKVNSLQISYYESRRLCWQPFFAAVTLSCKLPYLEPWAVNVNAVSLPVAKHNTPESCWVILYGNVYDVSLRVHFLP